jgi:CheY-like chemotaxis protein
VQRKERVRGLLANQHWAGVKPSFSAHHRSRARPQVLIVDDEGFILEFYVTFLDHEFPGLTVVTCTSTQEAMEQARKHAFHLAITDLVRPGPDSGYAFIEAFKQQCPDVPIWVFSAKALTEKEEALLGVDGSLQKPFGVEALRKRIGAFLNRPT